MKYLVLYDDVNRLYIDAENLEDCIIQFADYKGECSDLFLKALKGCHTPKDYIYMFEHFSEVDINAIVLVQQTFYDEVE